jgi:hypothetical protein
MLTDAQLRILGDALFFGLLAEPFFHVATDALMNREFGKAAVAYLIGSIPALAGLIVLGILSAGPFTPSSVALWIHPIVVNPYSWFVLWFVLFFWLTGPRFLERMRAAWRKRVPSRKPVIVYDGLEEHVWAWPRTGEKHKYAHLLFRNEPMGGPAYDAAAKLTWWDIKDTGQNPLFSVDGKWEKAQIGHYTTDLLPNRAPHGLDLFIRKPTAEDWSYGLDVSSKIYDRHHLNFGIVYKVKVTISCEGYCKDFWFQVATGPTISVHQYVPAEGERSEVRDAVQR